MASTERGGYTSRRTASTSYEDEDGAAAEDSGSTIHRLTAINELSSGGVDPSAPSGRNASNSWERFDDHIRRIATADPKEQYHKKKSTDKASETYRAALREFFYEDSDQEEGSNFSDSEDEELKKVVAAAANNSNDVFKDDLVGLPRNTPVEATSRRNRKGGKDGEVEWENGEKYNPSLRDKASTYGGHHQSKQKQLLQQQTDENAVKRMVLYEKYLERDNAWADGLTKCGKEILMEIQKRKKRPRRFVAFSKSLDNSRSSAVKSASRSVSYHL